MSDLTDFLLARIAEDEDAARVVMARGVDVSESSALWQHYDGDEVCIPSGRILAECEAKRRIVRAMQAAEVSGSPDYELGYGLNLAVHALAAVYSDHPDYRDEWRP